MTPRADVALILSRNRRAMDAERQELAGRIVAVVKRHGAGRDTLDALAYQRTMRDVDPILAEWYGRWPNDEAARFWRLILEQCRAARGLAYQRAVADVRRRLRREPALLERIEGEARG